MKIDHLNIDEIAKSGQCFRFKECARSLNEKEITYSVIIGKKEYVLSQVGDELSVNCTEKEFKEHLYDYFDLGTDYAYVEKLIRDSEDEHLLNAFETGSGIRILKQDLWEMIVSFLVSQNNNIPRIKKSIELICEKAGVEAESGISDKAFAFPGPEDVPDDFFEDTSLGLGYRAPYLKEMFAYVRENPGWVSYLKTLSYEEARKELLSHKGIGPKVADCICLFGLHHIDAFPIDTHVKQLLDKYYRDGFDFERFSGYAGVIQQYLFYYELVNS